MPISISLPKTPSKNYEDIVGEELAFAVYNTINEESTMRIGNMHVSFCQTIHPIETYAIKITNGKKTLVYTADTSYFGKEKLVEFAKGADLLICESSLLRAWNLPDSESHLTAKQAGLIAREAGVSNLMLTHFWPEEDRYSYLIEACDVFPIPIIAIEGLSFRLD